MSQNNFFWKMYRGELPPPNIAKTTNIEFTHIDTNAGTIETSFVIGDEFLNPMGQVQGGILAALLDDTMGPALVATLDENQFAPTLNLNVSFLMSAKPGKIVGKGQVTRKGKSICHLQGQLFNEEGELLATGTATAMIRSV